MAYKEHYGIPNGLDKSLLDHEIALTKSSHVRTVPLKVILFYVGSVMALFWVLSSTFAKDASFWLQALIVLWWIAATFYFGQYSKTQELRFQGVPALIDYLPTANRRVLTRRTSAAGGFYSIVGVKQVDRDGRIAFSDGTVGRAFLVVGSASILVFEADKAAIINRVDSFYRKIDATFQLIWVTTKEPQKVEKQLAHLERQNLALEVRDPELFDLLDEQASILTDYVGHRFNSVHQYLMIKADNDEALRRARVLLEAEVSDSSLMIKSGTALDAAGFLEMQRAIYTAS